MKKVQLADRLGNIQTKKIGFSWLHFLFGPIYSICTGHIFIAIGELVLYFFFLPIPGMEWIFELIKNIPLLNEEALKIISTVLLFFRIFPNYLMGSIFVFIVHLRISWRIRSRNIKRYMKRKELRPAEEKDARILIKYHASDENIGLAESFDIRGTRNYKSAEENWYENNQNRISSRPTFETRNNMAYTTEQKVQVQVEQIKNIYDLGLITKEEYNRRIKKLKDK